MNYQPKFIDHIVLMIKDVKRTEKFYSKILGKPFFKDKYSVAYKIASTRLFFVLPFKKIKRNSFSRNRIGLNHLAFGVRTLRELKKMEANLNKAGIRHSGIIHDRYQNREYIWFDDPDGIRQEFYLRPFKEK